MRSLASCREIIHFLRIWKESVRNNSGCTFDPLLSDLVYLTDGDFGVKISPTVEVLGHPGNYISASVIYHNNQTHVVTFG